MGKLIPYAGKSKEEKALRALPEGAKTARLDLRLTLAQKATLERIAKLKYRSINSLMVEWIDWLEQEHSK